MAFKVKTVNCISHRKSRQAFSSLKDFSPKAFLHMSRKTLDYLA